MKKAVAYFRTSSQSGVGTDKDSETRQQAAVNKYAEFNEIKIVQEFYDEAVSGTDHLVDRDGFSELMDFVNLNDIKIILIETVSRFARDVFVQLTGYQSLNKHKIVLIPVDHPEHFKDLENNPMAEAVMIIMATLSMLDKKMLCKRMKSGIEKKRRETGRCEGRKPAPPEAIEMAKRLYEEGLPLREIGERLAVAGYRVMRTVVEKDENNQDVRRREMTDKIYQPQSIKCMLGYKKPKKEKA